MAPGRRRDDGYNSIERWSDGQLIHMGIDRKLLVRRFTAITSNAALQAISCAVILWCAPTIGMAIRSLKQSPNRGRKGREEETRELLHPRLPYIVAYRVKEAVIEILTSGTPRAIDSNDQARPRASRGALPHAP